MIPPRGLAPPQRFPWGTYTLIGVNVTLFAYEITLEGRLQPFLLAYGWVPASFSQALENGHIPALTPLFISMFLHGGWFHLLGNLLYLHIFGGNVEGRLGHFRYLCFYCLGGGIAVLIQTSTSPLSPTPMIGASGAIATVAGAYCVFCPTARVLTLVPLPFSLRVVQIPAVCYLGLWLALQLLSGVFDLSPANGIAWGAHIGGFVTGSVLGPLFLLKKKRRPPYATLALPPLWDSPKSVLR
jgi:membrane associated rhomboid family serine protease